MDIVRLDTEALVELLKVLIFFLIFFAAGVISTVLSSSNDRLIVLARVDEVEFVDLVGSEQCEVVFAALAVDAIKLSKTAVGANNESVTKQTPNLA